MKPFVFAAAALWVAAASARPALAAAPPTLDGTYANARYGYTLRYSTSQLVPQPEAANGDGRVFRHKGGQGEVRVYGTYLPETLAEARAEAWSGYDAQGAKLSYGPIGKAWFVLSGVQPGRQFYHKAVRHEGAWLHLVFRYDGAARAAFVPMIEAMAARFPK